MTDKSPSDNTLTTSPDQSGQEGWAILGVPLRPSMKKDVQSIARQVGLKPAQWARLQIADAVARAKAA